MSKPIQKSLPILAVVKESEFTRREKIGWNQRGFATIRIDTMQEAIERLNRERYLFVLIDADNVNYKPLLGVMRDVTPIPIIIGTYNFTVADEVEALHNGADVYAPFQHQNEDNVMLALALLYSYNERSKRPKCETPIPYGKLLIVPDCWQVFCNDEEINLTKTEFEILLYLAINRGYILSIDQIYQSLWGIGYEGTDHKALYNHIVRIRKKLALATGTSGYIENMKGVGYRLPRIGGK